MFGGRGDARKTGWFRTAPHASAKPHNCSGKPQKSVLQKCSANGFCTTKTCNNLHNTFLLCGTRLQKNLRRKRLGRFGKLTENQHVYRTPPPAPQQVFRKPCSARPESFPHPGFSLPKLKCRKRVFSTPQHYVCRLTGLQAPR